MSNILAKLTTLDKILKEYRASESNGLTVDEKAELKKLREENRILKLEKELLKKRRYTHVYSDWAEFLEISKDLNKAATFKQSNQNKFKTATKQLDQSCKVFYKDNIKKIRERHTCDSNFSLIFAPIIVTNTPIYTFDSNENCELTIQEEIPWFIYENLDARFPFARIQYCVNINYINNFLASLLEDFKGDETDDLFQRISTKKL